MKKFIFASVVLFIIAGPVLAVPTVKLAAHNYQYGSGGPFTATVLTEGLPSHLVGTSFPTFCIEGNETISYGKSYYAEISDSAMPGGAGGPSPDPIGSKTAWLYDQFLNSTFTGNLVVDSKADGGLLQDAIWMFEEEKSMNTSNKYVAYANANCDWNDTGNIKVMRLWKY